MAEAVTSAPQPEDIELELFIEGLRRGYGIDFSGYRRASFKRRVLALTERRHLPDISALTAYCLRHPEAVSDITGALSVPTSDLFRDPQVFQRLRQEVLPSLSSFPRLTIWHAGCAGGEEAYSLAITLFESGLLGRSRIYATDISEEALARARDGIYALREARRYSANYRASGGTASFSDYMHANYERIKMHDWLAESMTFAAHNLSADGVFIETQLVLCRNVFIYFEHSLRERAVQLFAQSLVRGGYLLLGLREAMDARFMAQWFEPLGDGLYRRLATRA